MEGIAFTENELIRKPSAKDLDDFERERGVKLPVSYREFLMSSGGGRPVQNRIHFCGRQDMVAYVRGFDSGRPYLSIRGNEDFWGKPSKTGYLPVGANKGGDSWLMALRGDDYGAIFLWSHDQESIEPTTFDCLEKAFPSFEAFLEALGGQVPES